MSNFDDLDAMFNDDAMPVAAATSASSQTSAATASISEATAEPVQVYAAPVATHSASVVASGVADDFEIDMPEELQQSLADMGVVVGDIGTKISKVPIEKYKASTAKIDRISFLTKKVIALKFHYVEGVGSIVCFGGKCCEMGGSPNIRYLFPIAVYSTDSEGNISGKKVELKILAAGEDLYKSIMTINKGTTQYGGIDHADLLVTCTDDKFQKITLTFAGNAVWRKYAPIAEFLSERWKKDGANAYMAVARKCDEASFLKLLGMGDDSESSNDSYDPGQNADLSKFFED